MPKGRDKFKYGKNHVSNNKFRTRKRDKEQKGTPIKKSWKLDGSRG